VEQGIVTGQRDRHGSRLSFPETGAPFDIGEEESDVLGLQVRHERPSLRGALPSSQEPGSGRDGAGRARASIVLGAAKADDGPPESLGEIFPKIPASRRVVGHQTRRTADLDRTEATQGRIVLACPLMALAQPRGELGLAAVDGNTERRPTVAREGGRSCRADGGGALRFRPGKGRFLEPRVQEAHAGDIVSARLLPFGLDRLPVLVALEGAHLDGSRRIEQIGQSGLSRFRHTPRPGPFPANAVAEAGLPLDDEDSQAGSGQYPTVGRSGDPPTDDGDIEDWRGHRRSTL
jgi:hypothetical protein